MCPPPALSLFLRAQDIELCATAIRHAGDRIAPAYRFALSLLGGMRRWTFLPTLTLAAPFLVLLKGGDALSVCFNTVAVLFLCEIDNLLYAILLPERERARVEVEGRVELGEAEAAALMRSKAVHVAVLVVAVPCAVVLGGSARVVFSAPQTAALASWTYGAHRRCWCRSTVLLPCRPYLRAAHWKSRCKFSGKP